MGARLGARWGSVGQEAPKMPKRVPPLTQLQIKNAKPCEKPYKLADGGGLYLEVTPSGGKHWRMKYRQPNGKENKLHFGAFPAVSLLDARERRDSARQLLAAGADPARARDEQARQARMAAANTFEQVAREWHQTMLAQWQPQTARDVLHRFEQDVFLQIGKLAIIEIQSRDVIDAIRAVERRGALEIASRLAANCSRVFRYAMRCRLAERNPGGALAGGAGAEGEGPLRDDRAGWAAGIPARPERERGLHGIACAGRDAPDAAGVRANFRADRDAVGRDRPGGGRMDYSVAPHEAREAAYQPG